MKIPVPKISKPRPFKQRGQLPSGHAEGCGATLLSLTEHRYMGPAPAVDPSVLDVMVAESTPLIRWRGIAEDREGSKGRRYAPEQVAWHRNTGKTFFYIDDYAWFPTSGSGRLDIPGIIGGIPQEDLPMLLVELQDCPYGASAKRLLGVYFGPPDAPWWGVEGDRHVELSGVAVVRAVREIQRILQGGQP